MITLSAEVEGGLTVAYASALGTAEGTDVSVAGTSASFTGTAGETQNVVVTIVGDDIVEDNETFSITLGDVTGTSAVQDAAITTGDVSSGTINNDDTATLSISTISTAETNADQAVTATVSVDAAVEGGFTVAYAAAALTAETTDFSVSGSSLLFAGTAGESQDISVTLVGDAIVEADETFTITLGDVTGTTTEQDASLTTGAQSTNTIVNDDTASLTINDVTVDEDAGTATFTVTSSHVSEAAIVVSVGLTDGTTTAADVTLATSTATIAGDSTTTSASVTVNVTDDRRVEGQETYTLTLSGATWDAAADATRAVITDAIAAGAVDDNETVDVSFAATTSTVDEDTATSTIDVDLTISSTGTGAIGLDRTMTVDVNRTGGTASPADPEADLSYTDTTLSFSAADGDAASFTKSVSVEIFEDILDDDAETLILSLQSLSDGSGGQASIGSGTHTLTITDDDTDAAVFDLVAGAGDVRITANGADLEVYVGGVLQTSRAFADVTSLLVQGTADNESLTLDFSNGVFTTDITFDGAAGDDTVFIVGAAAGSDVVVSYDAVDAEAGQVDIDGTVLTYQDIENNSLNISGTSNLTLEFAGGDTGINLTRLSGTQTQVTGSSFTTTNFTSPSDSLTLSFSDTSDYTAAIVDLADDFDPTGGLSVIGAAGGGNTALTIDELGGLNGRAVAIDLGGGTDAVVFQNAALSLSSLNVTAETITATSSSLSVTTTTVLDAGATGSMTLDNVAHDFGGAVTITQAQDVVLDDAGDVTFGGINATGNVSIDAGGVVDFSGTAVVGGDLNVESGANGTAGAITDSTGMLSVTGTTTLNAGTADITLDNAASSLTGNVSIVAAANAELAAASAVSLSTVNTTADLTVSAASIDVVNTVTVGGGLSLTAGTGNLTDTGAGNLQVTGTSTLSAAVDVLLDAATNDFADTVTVTTARDVTLTDVNAVDLGAVNATRDLTISAASVTITGSVDVGGAASLTAGAGGIVDTGAGQVDVQGSTTLSAAADVVLDAAANDFGGQVLITTADNVTLVDQNDLTLATSGVTTDLTATATAVDVAQVVTVGSDWNVQATAGSITDSTGQTLITGTSTLAASVDVVLDNATSQLGVVNASGVNVTIVDSTVLDVGLIQATQAVILTSALSLQDATADTTLDITGTSIDLNAAAGIGDVRHLEIAAATVQADTTAGDIDLDSITATAVEVTSLTTGDGAVTFDQSGGGDVSFSGSVSSGGAAVGGDISLTSTAGLTVTGTATVSSLAGTGGTLTLSGVSVAGQIQVGGGNVLLSGGGPDLVIAADLSASSDVLLNAARDVIISAIVDAGNGADIAVTADTNAGIDTGSGPADGHGGVQITAAGLLDAEGDVTISGSDLFATAASVDAVRIDSDGTSSQVISGGSVLIQNGGNAPDAAATVIEGRVSTTAAAGTIDILAAGDVLLGVDGDVAALTGAVSLTADQATGSLGGRVVMDDGAQVTATSGSITVSADGSVLLGQLSTASTVTITSTSGAIVDNGNSDVDIVAAAAALSAHTGIGDDADAVETAGSTTLLLAATTDSGDIVISNIGALVVGTVGSVNGVSIVDAAGAGVDPQDSGLDNIRLTAASPLTVNVAISNADGGGIALTSTNDGGDDDHLTINASLSITGGDAAVDGTGNIDLSAGTDLVIGAGVATDGGGTITGIAARDVLVTSGTLASATGGQSYTATGGNVTMTDGSLIQSTGAGVSLTAGNSVTVAAVAAATRATLTAANGGVLDGGASGTDVVASELVISAATGIGTSDELETTVDQLAFANSTSGDVRVTNSQTLQVASVGTVTTSGNAGGDIELCVTAGDLSVNTAMSAAGNTIRLQADSGTISQSSSGILTAMALGTRATGSVSLAAAANDVATLAAASTVSGSVTFRDANGFTVGSVAAGDCFTATTGVTTIAGGVTLTADGGDLVNTDSVTAGGAGHITLTTTGGNVILTGQTTAADDSVTINSGGSINGSGLITAMVVDLNAQSGIGQTTPLELAASVITADTLAGAVDVDNVNAMATTVNSLTTGAGAITLEQSGAGSVDFVTVTSGSGSVTLQNTGGDLTVSGTATAGGTGNMTLTTVTAGAVILTGVATADGNQIDVVSADQIQGDAGNTAADLVATDLTLTAVNGIGDGAAVETNVSTLTFVNSLTGDVHVTNASALQLGSGSNSNGHVELCVLAGDLILSGLLTAGTNTVRLQADAGQVAETATGVINAGQLGVRAATGVTLATATNSVATFAATTTTGAIQFVEADGFQVATVTAGDCFTAVTGVTATTGGVTLQALTGPLQISDVVTTTSGNIDIDADGGLLTIDAVVSSTSGSLDLTADVIQQNAGVQTGGAGSLAMTADAGSLTMADGTQALTSSGSLTLSATTDVALSQLSSVSGAVSVSAGGAITDNTALELPQIVTTGQVTLAAVTGIGGAGAADIDTQIDSLQAVNTTSADIVIQEVDGLVVNGTGVVTSGGNGAIDLHVLAGDLTTSAAISADGSGNVVLVVDSGDFENNATVRSVTGDLQVQATAVRQNADLITAGSGTAQVTAVSTITMADGSSTTTAGGGIAYLAGGDVRLSRLNAGSGTVDVTSTGGSLLDQLTGEGSGSENVVGGAVTLIARGDIGSVDDLDLDAATLNATSTGTGRIHLAESGAVGTTVLQTANGPVDLVAAGSITGVSATSLTDAAANDILIRSDTGDVGVNLLTAGTLGDVTVQATLGSINDLLAGVNIVAQNLNAVAAADISLDTTVGTITAASTSAGSVLLQDSDDVVLTSVTTADGSITVTAMGTLTATSVSAGGGAGDNVSLSTTTGGLLATSVTAADDVTLLAQAGSVTATSVQATAGTVDIDATTGDVLLDSVVANGPIAPAVAVDVFAGNDILDLNGADLNIQATSGSTRLTAGRDVGFASTDVFKPTADDPLEVHTADLQIQAGRNVAVFESGSASLTLLTADVAFLTSAGDLDFSSAVVTTNSLSVVAGGTLTLPPAATPLTVSGDLRLEAADLAVTAGTIDINAARLLLKSGQAETLHLTVTEFDGQAGGDLTIHNDSAALTLVDLDCYLTALDVGTSVATINQTTAALVSQRLPVTGTENSRIVAGGLVLNGTGTFELTNTTNDVDQLAGLNSGAITVADLDDVTVANIGTTVGLTSGNQNILLQTGTGLQLSQQLNAGTADVRLAAGGGVSQSATGPITADELAIRDTSTAAVRLAATNAVRVLAVDNAAGGDVTFADTDALVVDQVAGANVANLSFAAVSGVTGDDLLLQAGGTLDLNQQLTAGTGLNDVRLIAGGAVNQAAAGIVVADELGVRQEGAAGDVLLDDANQINTLAVANAAAGGRVAVRNTQNLTLGSVALQTVDGVTFAATQGVSTSNGNVLVQADQTLQINAPVTAGTAEVRLSAAAGVAQSATGALSAAALGIRNTVSGDIDLGAAANDVDVLAVRQLAETAGVRFFDADDLSVGQVAADTIGLLSWTGVVGVDTNAGDVELTAETDLTVNENINAAHDTLTTSIDESIVLISRNGDFLLADNRSLSTDEDTTAGAFDDVTGDEVTILAGSGGTSGLVSLGDNTEVRTDGGVARQIAPRPTAFAALPTVGAESAFVTLTNAENSRSNLNFVSGGFLGELDLVFGVAGEENLEVVVDWGVVSQTDFNTDPATDATQVAPGEFAFGLGDADKAVFFIDQGGASYVIPHLYAPADLLTTDNDRNGRDVNPNIIGVRFSVAQHESINIWGRNATDPGGTPDTAPPVFSGTSPTVIDANGVAIMPGSNLALLSATDTNGLDQFNQEAAQLPLDNLVNTPTGQPEGFAEWEFLAGPSPGVIPVTRFTAQSFELPTVETPEITQVVTTVFGDVSLDSGAAGESAIGTEVYLQIRRHFELDAEAEVVIQRITDNSFISSREAFEAFVEENPVLQDGDGYEVWLITETSGQKIARPIVEFEITGGRPGPATEELPETFEPYRLQELEFEQPEQPQPGSAAGDPATDPEPGPPAGDDETALHKLRPLSDDVARVSGDDDRSSLVDVRRGETLVRPVLATAAEQELSDEGATTATADRGTIDHATIDNNRSENATSEFGQGDVADAVPDSTDVGAAVIGVSAAARWRRQQSRADQSLTRAALLARKMRRSGPALFQEPERTHTTDSQHG